MQIVHTDGKDPAFVTLCELLDLSLDEYVGGPAKREKYCPFNQLDAIFDAVIIYIEDEPVASGSYKHYADSIAEIKRVFVKKEQRRKGLSKILMHELEAKAKAAGYRSLYLETGDLLAPAMALYKSLGFKVIENYGPYVAMPESVCMAKRID